MPTRIEGPDVLEQLTSMRPDTEAIDRAWNQNRRQAALQHALTTDAPKRPVRIRRRTARSLASRWIGAGVAAAAVSTAVFLLVPGSLAPKPVPAIPAVTPTPTPTEPAPTAEPDPGVELAEVTVSTVGWKTFDSPEYPITFSYPADWELHFSRHTPTTAKEVELTPAGIVDGCGVDGCTLYVSPPGQNIEGGHSVVLMRNGFQGDAIDAPYDGATVLAAIPDLKVWTSTDTTAPSTAAILTRSANGYCVRGCSPDEDFGPPYEYMLSTGGLAENIAVGEANPVAGQPEAFFSFGTNWGPEGKEAKTVATILASSRPNPDFNPTQPATDSSGRYRFWMSSMEAPTLGVDFKGWKVFDLPDGNVSVRVPPKWTVKEYRDGIILLTAPSGYTIALLTNGEAELGCRPTSKRQPTEKLGTLPGVVATDARGVSRPVEIWWQDATWHPAEVLLRLVQPSDENTLCSQSVIDYGGKHPVSLGSADNLKNPTPTELDQAVAILASLERQS